MSYGLPESVYFSLRPKTVHVRGATSEVAAVVVSLYPELEAYPHHDRKWKQRFHCNMFDAVAVGITAESYRNGRA